MSHFEIANTKYENKYDTTNHLEGTRLTGSPARLQPSHDQTARRVHIVCYIPTRYRHLQHLQLHASQKVK
jgi:hypothetical protein